MRFILINILFFCVSRNANGMRLETLKKCCTVGENYSTSGMDCKTFKPPIANVEKRYEAACLRTVDVCCKKKLKEGQCNLGITDAKQGACGDEDGERKDCCEACSVGISMGKAGEPCVDSYGLGEGFVKCCEEPESIPSTTSSSTTTSTSTTTIKPTSEADLDPDKLENLDTICDSDVCAQLCEVTESSYKCSCYPNYVLMGDGVSCRPLKKAQRKGSRCDLNNPCDQRCVDTGTAIKCECDDGYSLGSDHQTCEDIDECAMNLHDCQKGEECINDVGSFSCIATEIDEDPFQACPKGYHFSGTTNKCEDINECEFDIVCERPKTCENTMGSYVCKGDDRELCPSGYHFNGTINDCSDIDECLTDEHNCNKDSQVCLNTKGNYTCQDKASKKHCPPGFKNNASTGSCEDIDECNESDDLCKSGEVCVNEPGGYKCANKVTTTTPRTFSTRFPTKPIKPVPKAFCQKGFEHNGVGCHDIDECESNPCDSTQECVNQPGSYTCNCKIGYTKDPVLGAACVDINECLLGNHDCSFTQRCDNSPGSYVCNRIVGCGTGYTFNYGSGLCEDDDECALNLHNCDLMGPGLICKNLLGTYICEKPATPKPKTTPRNPFYNYYTSTARSNPTTTRPTSKPITTRYYNPVTTKSTPRVYPNYYTQTTTIRQTTTPFYSRYYTTTSSTTTPKPTIYFVPTTPPWIYHRPQSNNNVYVQTRFYNIPDVPNTEKPIIMQNSNCLPGYRKNARGVCEDINECLSNPCEATQKCININGSFRCSDTLICKVGYEPNDAGSKCVDINECSRGTHTCHHTQICKNGQGYYTCECPLGYHIDKATFSCVDMDECKHYRPCLPYALCENTPGSYRCTCKDGFKREGPDCIDIDECKETTGLCSQKCLNQWGSYRCACNSGFKLNPDNRTCSDIDECEKYKDKNICMHKCQNIPGSYACECPSGYRLGNDRKVCIDINECSENACNPHESCINIGGGYKCYPIECPPGYHKDSSVKSICKRIKNYCDPRTTECQLMPEQYSYQYITIVSDIPLLDEPIQLFQISGPSWSQARVDFSLSLLDVDCPHQKRIDLENYFKKEVEGSIMRLYLTRSPTGPQEATLQIDMKLYNGNAIIGNIVVYIVVIVSEFPF
ncbi:unnamed protein product [Brassicogethes aeneus]|uniref:EGF-like domain-containing protein n=1 Tax=Brassicogethes aeneus TaxID=1431903 RepID=A0A9P0BDW8_BRAAE|nr:unnamed protein product [Brassicogethes aeneus]